MKTNIGVNIASVINAFKEFIEINEISDGIEQHEENTGKTTLDEMVNDIKYDLSCTLVSHYMLNQVDDNVAQYEDELLEANQEIRRQNNNKLPILAEIFPLVDDLVSITTSFVNQDKLNKANLNLAEDKDEDLICRVAKVRLGLHSIELENGMTFPFESCRIVMLKTKSIFN